MGKSSAPPTPDYIGAANATAAGNLDAARAAADANRVNQVTPYGNLTYTHDSGSTLNQSAYDQAMQNYQNQLSSYNAGGSGSSGGTQGIGWKNANSGSAMQKPVMPNQADYMTGGNPDSGWTATTSLTPAQQSILDKNNALSGGLLDTAQSGLNYAQGVMSQPGVDTSKLPQVGINPGQTYQDAMMSRLQPQIDRENQQSDAQLANQGVMPGSVAYNNAKQVLNQSHNDLLNNATVQGFNTGLAANQNSFQQQSYNQMQPINVINALRTGSQVQGPQFTNVPQQQTTAGPDILGATNSLYNAQLGNVNAQNASSANTTSGLIGLAGTAAALF